MKTFVYISVIAYMAVAHILTKYYIAPPVTEKAIVFFNVARNQEEYVYFGVFVLFGIIFFVVFAIFFVTIRNLKK